MKTNEMLNLIGDKDFLDKMYPFSYRRCNTSHEAEDLCSDIILAVISAVYSQDSVDNFYAFAWTIARRVYADYSENRSRMRQTVSIEDTDPILTSEKNEIDNFIEEAAEQEYLAKIFAEIAFLSKAYREVMVMYYIDELKVKDIAVRLNISEATVKQRLFYARNTIREEVKTMNERTYALKPVKLAFSGTGNPIGNDPRSKTERVFSHNLIYLCKDKPRSAKELSEELCVPMPYIEDELEIQCHGENGQYGMLRKLDNGKYAVNIHLADYDEYDRANKIYEKHLEEFCDVICRTLKQNEEKILSFPFLSVQRDIRFIMWSLISRTVWDFQDRINDVLAEKYFTDITPVKRDFSCVAVAYTDEQKPAFDFYGSDGIYATEVGGYRNVFVSNIYGNRLDKHFSCGHNISQDQKLLMTLRAIGGVSIDELSETEKEFAAKAIECGYLCKNGNMLEPKIVVIDKKNEMEFYQLSFDLNNDMGDIIDQIAGELTEFMRTHIPEHLMNEYQIYTTLISGIRILSKAIEKCIDKGLLSEPENRLGAEGIYMVVKK